MRLSPLRGLRADPRPRRHTWTGATKAITPAPMLNIIRHDGPAGPTPLLIAHGLYGSARNWGVIAKRLSSDRAVIAVDMRNHGLSPWYDSHSYGDMAADLAAVIRAQGVPMAVLGHSMGGKAAMMLALHHPDLVANLIVGDIAPVAYAHDQTPYIRAMQAVDLAQVEKRSDAEAQLAALVDDPSLPAFFTQSLDLKDRRWRLNLDILADQMPHILGFPAVDTQFTGPTLFLTGATSHYVQPAHRDRIKGLFPAARFAKIPGAGHWLHAEKPREFEAAVRAWLAG